MRGAAEGAALLGLSSRKAAAARQSWAQEREWGARPGAGGLFTRELQSRASGPGAGSAARKGKGGPLAGAARRGKRHEGAVRALVAGETDGGCRNAHNECRACIPLLPSSSCFLSLFFSGAAPRLRLCRCAARALAGEQWRARVEARRCRGGAHSQQEDADSVGMLTGWDAMGLCSRARRRARARSPQQRTRE